MPQSVTAFMNQPIGVRLQAASSIRSGSEISTKATAIQNKRFPDLPQELDRLFGHRNPLAKCIGKSYVPKSAYKTARSENPIVHSSEV